MLPSQEPPSLSPTLHSIPLKLLPSERHASWVQVPKLPASLYVDCANGVGAQHLARAAVRLAAAVTGLHLHLLNLGGQP